MERARDLGIPFDGIPGPYNAISDVEGVTVGYTTLISGEGKLEIGQGPVRTGVTVILPRGATYDPVFAGIYSQNGNGEMTGAAWVEESGFLETPIALTNTHSVGVVRDALVAWIYENKFFDPNITNHFWTLPVVAETYDGRLNDIMGFHVKPEHVFSALGNAASGILAEGCAGGGTGMICHGFKGGTGTASRRISIEGVYYNLGALVQANHGSRESLKINGVPVGKEIPDLMPEFHYPPLSGERSGSIIVIIATDAPLIGKQLTRLAKRVPMGIARVGGVSANSSGDIFLAFSTANNGAARRSGIVEVKMLPNDLITPLFEATIQATEEAIVNCLVGAQTTTGINHNVAYALPHARLIEVLGNHRAL